jgi:hypothetical protein
MGQAAPAIIMMIGSAVSAVGQYQAGKTQERIALRNQELAEQAAADAVERGNLEEEKHRLQVGALVAKQRALIASAGVEIGTGSPIDIFADTAAKGELDILTIRNNARREAWGLKGQALNFGYQGKLAKSRGAWGASSTAFQGAATSYSLYKNR